MSLKGIIIAGAGYVGVILALARMASAKWHPDKGSGLERMPEHTVEGIPQAWQNRTDEEKENG